MSVSWLPPLSDQGAEILYYSIWIQPDEVEWTISTPYRTGPSGRIYGDVSPLLNTVQYHCYMEAHNRVDVSYASTDSADFTPCTIVAFALF